MFANSLNNSTNQIYVFQFLFCRVYYHINQTSYANELHNKDLALGRLAIFGGIIKEGKKIVQVNMLLGEVLYKIRIKK